MKKAMLLCLVLTLLLPLQALAYSYGDPAKEDIAETYSLIQAKLNASTPDWDGALEAYKVRRSEISSHFGEAIAVTLDQNFKNKQKEELTANYRYVLYLNLDRRFTYAKKDIQDYGKAKLLIGKAKGTFDVLKPYLQSKISGQVANLEAAMEKTLKALGNPGLFGVGQESVQPEEFEKQTSFILATIKPIFPYQSAKPAAKEQPKQAVTQAPKAEPKVPAKDPAKKSKPTEQKAAAQQTAAKHPVAEQLKSEQPAVTPEQPKSDHPKSEEPKPEETALKPTIEAPKEESVTEEPAAKDVVDTTASETADKAQEVVTPEVETAPAATQGGANAAEEHAPMERQSKTNPWVSLVVIGAVMLIGGAGIWFVRKNRTT